LTLLLVLLSCCLLAITMTTAAPTALQSVRYSGDARTLQVLDQLKLPHETVYIDVPHVDAAFSVIRSMQIRGKGWFG
jgi:hypothetical protein